MSRNYNNFKAAEAMTSFIGHHLRPSIETAAADHRQTVLVFLVWLSVLLLLLFLQERGKMKVTRVSVLLLLLVVVVV